MRIVRATRFGGPEVLEVGRAPDPVAGPGQVVIAVSVVDVLFLDTQLRSGWGQEFFGLRPPYVPGSGVAGTVASVGEDVDPGWLGRPVVTMVEGGAYAEQVVAEAARLVPVPDGLDRVAAGALLQIGPAALALVAEAALEPGEWVLVTAAGGGLGSLLVQLARAAGARVVAAAGSEPKLQAARDLGAELPADYSTPDWADRVRAATGGVRVVFDGVGGRIGAAAWESTASGGRFFAYGAPSGAFTGIDPEEAKRRDIAVSGIERVQFTPDEARRLAARALAEAAAGRIRPVIGRTFPLDRAADAHAAIEARDVVGKTLLLA